MSDHAELLQQLLDMGRRMEKRLDELNRKIDGQLQSMERTEEVASTGELAVISASSNPLAASRERERETGREKKEGGFRGTSKIKTA